MQTKSVGFCLTACHQMQLDCHLPLADRVLISVCKQLIYYCFCCQNSLLMLMCICSHSPVLAAPSQHLFRSPGIRFSSGIHNLYPSHLLFTVGFMLLWESNVTADLTGGEAQAVMGVMGSGCKYRGCLTSWPATLLLLCGPVPNRPQTNTSLWPRVGNPWYRV